MLVIREYKLKETTERQVLRMSRSAPILSVQTRASPRTKTSSGGSQSISLWAEIITETPNEDRVIVMIPASHEIDFTPRVFLGTVQVRGFAWHVYEDLTRR